jgi:hypothetical protein
VRPEKPWEGNEIGWNDPRALDEDEEILTPRQLAANENLLAWPARGAILLVCIVSLIVLTFSDQNRKVMEVQVLKNWTRDSS